MYIAPPEREREEKTQSSDYKQVETDDEREKRETRNKRDSKRIETVGELSRWGLG